MQNCNAFPTVLFLWILFWLLIFCTVIAVVHFRGICQVAYGLITENRLAVARYRRSYIDCNACNNDRTNHTGGNNFHDFKSFLFINRLFCRRNVGNGWLIYFLERPSRNGASFSKELLQKRLYKRNQVLNANSPFVITDEILEHHYLIKKSRILSLSEP